MADNRTSASQENVFERFADWMSYTIGRPGVFILALMVIAVWAVFGPVTGFTNTWQLFINSFTTIVTFLMVFLLGNASNRITENQDTMLENIYNEEEHLKDEEELIERLIDRIDLEHIQPILQHLDQQDHQVEAMAERILMAIQGNAKA
jgi:low affinity Fe/Cu permease